MGWTQPKTWSSEPLTAADMNTHIRDNLMALKDPATGIYDANETTDLALNSTSWADADASAGKLEQTLTTNGGAIMVGFSAAVGVSANLVIYLDVSVDGTAYGVTTLSGPDGLWAKTIANTTTVDGSIDFFRFLLNIPAGSHIFRLRYKVSNGTITIFRGAATVNADIVPQFFVREVS